VLIRQYLKMGGRLLGFNIDPSLSNALDAPIVADLRSAPPALLERCMGRPAAKAFLERQNLGLSGVGSVGDTVFQQAAARRGILRIGMSICKGSIASSGGWAGGTTRSGLSQGGCAPAHKLHGHRNELSGETVVITCSLYIRCVSGE
jgi:hypothetical protein